MSEVVLLGAATVGEVEVHTIQIPTKANIIQEKSDTEQLVP